jgi:two-component system nitrogen regulation sensor histidine kinase GlnL
MSENAAARSGEGRSPGGNDPASVLNALAEPVLALDEDDAITYVNSAAEQFFGASASVLLGHQLKEILPADSTVFSLLEHIRAGASSVTEYNVSLETPKIGSRLVTVDAAAIAEEPGRVVVSLREMSIARKMNHQLTHRGAARSVIAMGAMLAHEVKNPLAGIRGAAQLLEGSLDESGAELTRLICDEADRIVALVDRMEMFADERPISRTAVNIHEVLEHVRKVTQTAFAPNVRFIESYDPSLPPVYGNRDLLIQALLNLVKNAGEAFGGEPGEIELLTRFQQGVRMALPASNSRVDLPLLVSIRDNGPGIPEDMQPHLFDPFVSSKPSGKGLGLALVAKIVNDHGGIIEFDSEPRRTVFRLMLPMAPAELREEAE